MDASSANGVDNCWKLEGSIEERFTLQELNENRTHKIVKLLFICLIDFFVVLELISR